MLTPEKVRSASCSETTPVFSIWRDETRCNGAALTEALFLSAVTLATSNVSGVCGTARDTAISNAVKCINPAHLRNLLPGFFCETSSMAGFRTFPAGTPSHSCEQCRWNSRPFVWIVHRCGHSSGFAPDSLLKPFRCIFGHGSP